MTKNSDTHIDWDSRIRKIADYLGCNEGELVSEVSKLLADARREVIRKIEQMPIETVGNSAKTVEQILATLRKEEEK